MKSLSEFLHVYIYYSKQIVYCDHMSSLKIQMIGMIDLPEICGGFEISLYNTKIGPTI